MDRVNVDTDQIIPKQFLKRVERTGYGEFLFFDWRFNDDGTDNKDFILNQPAYQGANIIVAGRNFGCGSSREHAPWALGEYGFRVVIAPSFADIFFNNCLQNGLLNVILPEDQVNEILKRALDNPGYRMSVDLEKQEVSDDTGWKTSFDIDEFQKFRLMNGLDDIGLTLQNEEESPSTRSTAPATCSSASSLEHANGRPAGQLGRR